MTQTSTQDAFKKLSEIAADITNRENLTLDEIDDVISAATDAYGKAKDRIQNTRNLLKALNQS